MQYLVTQLHKCKVETSQQADSFKCLLIFNLQLVHYCKFESPPHALLEIYEYQGHP